ncbi:DUF6502 family protein [Lichenibacterium ramalinae]|uniref:Uncharacterized protein n=1 Tax=Lichenibacterium ramalinae TaxID=2316527 RepID=A0A4Q2R9X7_9HYPH|nr:DUF6502 family protein [Lichenibacterium ramalinae]RYB03015.1 hypothetical protein D3272_18240 [Lichenibacterium ramalinae]
MPKDVPLDTSRLQAALLRVLRPLVRLLVRRGITFPALCDMLRELYVNVAEHDFSLPGKEQTDSRVSLLTGIHRKEVRRLRGAGAPVNAVPAALSRTSRILARWLADRDTTDEAGLPLPLPRVAPAGRPSFEALVASVTRDVRPRAVLDEWIDRRLAVLDADDVVTLLDRAFVPQGGDEQQLYYFGRNLHDHVASAVANISAETPRFLERAVHYDGLSEAVAADLERRSRALAMDALTAANRQAHRACESDAGGRWRWNFGVYVFAEELPPPGEAEGTAAPRPPEDGA